MIEGDANKILMAVAHDIWRKTYGSGGGEAEAMVQIAKGVEAMQDGNAEDMRATDTARLVFAVQWIHSACVTLTTNHKFAAALCASTSREESVLEDLTLPAKAFRVLVPNGILANDRFNLEFSQINVCVLENGQALFHLEGLGAVIRKPGSPDAGSRRLASLPVFFTARPGQNPIAELLADRDDDEQAFIVSQMAEEQQTPSELETRKRMHVLARRLVAGLLLTFTHTTNWQERNRGSRQTGQASGREPPKHRNIFIGRPMSLDARPALQAYLGGSRRAPPSVQTLVRGHHKRQVIGVARSGRKVIWVEPYWRGPETAPIMTRPYRVGPVLSNSEEGT